MPQSLVPQAAVASAELPSETSMPVAADSAVSAARLDELVGSGIRSIQENQLSAAAESFEAVLKLDADNATAHHGLAMVADLNQQWSDAEFHYKQALRSRPRDAGLLNDLGYSYLLQNRFHEASRYLSQAVEQNPQHEKAHENLAMLSLRQGDRQAAEQHLQLIYPVVQIPQQIQRMETQLRESSGIRTLNPGVAESLPVIRENASFEEVRALAEQQRKLAVAERQRRHTSAPAVHAASPDTVGGVQPAAYPGPSVHPAPPVPGQGVLAQRPAVSGFESAAAAGPVSTPPPYDSRMTNGGMAQGMAQGMAATQPPALQPPALQVQNHQAMAAPAVSASQYSAPPFGTSFDAYPSTGLPLSQNSSSGVNGAAMALGHGESGTRTLAQPTGSVISIQPGMSRPQSDFNQAVQTPGTAFGNSGQAVTPFPLAGLNAGPGTLFPVNAPQGSAMPNAHGSPSTAGQVAFDGTLASLSAAGTGTVTGAGAGAGANGNHVIQQPGSTPSMHATAVHGAMFPQASSVLPVQQVATSVNMPHSSVAPSQSQGHLGSPQISPAGAMLPQAGGSTGQPGYSDSRNSTMQPPAYNGGVASQAMGVAPSGTNVSSSGSPQYGAVSAPNPLEAYERQLQQLNTEYGQSLQQFERPSSSLRPVQAQY